MATTGMTADEAISIYKRASIRREFPSEFLSANLEHMESAAHRGNRAARTALKLLFDGRFDK
jgi:hypothetical protein